MAKEKNIQFPYQDFSLDDIEGEKWAAFPGFETIYMISNLGRVKSLTREVAGGYGSLRTIQGKILAPILTKEKSRSTGICWHHLGIRLHDERRCYVYKLSRIVYYVFKKKFPLNSKSLIISFKDGDGRNLHPSNLELTTRTEHRHETIKNNRTRLPAKKAVTLYDSTGKPIAWFDGIREAARKTGIAQSHIQGALKNESSIAGGYFWRKGIHKERLEFKDEKDGGIHEALAKKLKLENIDRKNPPAFLNLSLASMPGEQWKEIPGYESTHQVSNYGRVKALNRVLHMGADGFRLHPAQILRLNPTGSAKGKVSLSVNLSNLKGTKSTSISRFVYYLFVENFDLNDPKKRIFFKDENPLNLHYQNLILAGPNYATVRAKLKLRELKGNKPKVKGTAKT